MGAMQQVVGKIELGTLPKPMYLHTAQQQVKTTSKVHAKFFADDLSRERAWQRYLSLNNPQIVTWNYPKGRVMLADGSFVMFATASCVEDLERYRGSRFYTLDIDLDISDPVVMSRLRTLIDGWI